MKPSSESLKLRGKVGSRKWPSVFHSARTFSPVLLQFPALPDKHQPYNRSHTSACGLPVLHSAGIILPEIKLCTAVICFSLSTSSYSIPSSEPIRSSVPPCRDRSRTISDIGVIWCFPRARLCRMVAAMRVD